MRSEFERLMKGVQFNSPILYSLEDMYKQIMLGKMQLWLAMFDGERPHLCMVTRLVEHDQGKVLYIVCLAGAHIRSVMHLRKDLEQWAMMQGCQYISADMRPKLQRMLRRFGYHATAVTVYKSLVSMH
jgi:hypothetical protein